MPQDVHEANVPPLACRPVAFTAEQRERYQHVRASLFSAVQQVQELTDGYVFLFSPDSALLPTMAEFVSLERLCCPFLDFTIQVERANGPLSLQMTGPAGAKEILRAALHELTFPDANIP